MTSITGLRSRQAQQLTEIISTIAIPGLPPMMPVRLGLLITMISLWKNRTQEDLAVTFDVSQPTVSRTITALTRVIASVIDRWTPQLVEVRPGVAYVVDGTLVPCWSWKHRKDRYSGKSPRPGTPAVGPDHRLQPPGRHRPGRSAPLGVGPAAWLGA